jgi:hypothetical protein
MSEEEKHDWNRLPRETSRSYQLFSVYRNLGPERSLAKARESAKCIPSVARLKVLSRKWNWVERCKRYDDYQEHQDRLRHEKEREQMRQRHAKIAVLGQNIVVREMESLLAKAQNGGSQMTPADVARLMDVTVKVERLARGESTDRHEVSGPGGGPVQIDHRVFVLAVRRALGFRDPEWAEIEPGNNRQTSLACLSSVPSNLPPGEVDESR